MSTYRIIATLRRPAGATKEVCWSYEGRGSGTQAWRAWSHILRTDRTHDTDEPITSAFIAKDDTVVDRCHAGQHREESAA